MKIFHLFAVAICIHSYSVLATGDNDVKADAENQSKVVYESARLETCGGWRLNRLPKVKAFIYDHADLYKNFKVEYIGGADPELVFVKADKSEERIPVDTLTTKEICQLLDERGFEKIPQPDIPSPPGEGEDDDPFSGDEDEEPGMEEEDPEISELRGAPAAPGREDEVYMPAPEEKVEL